MSKKIPNKIRESRDKPKTGAFSVTEAFNQACNAKSKLTLYRFVYRSRISFAVVFALCFSFFVQGIERANAEENTELVSESISTTSVDEGVADNNLAEDTNSIEADIEDATTDEQFEISEENNSDTNTTPIIEAPDEGDNSLDNEITEGNNEEGGEEEGMSEVIDEGEGIESGTDAGDGAVVEDDEAEEVVDEEVIDEESVEDLMVNPESASSSEVLGDTVVVVESDSAFSFSRDECTVLASGSFYCAKPGERGLEDDLFAAPDIDGDMEIFFTKDGEQSQVTKNQVDDAAPFYDKNSDTIVWHRLLNDRYQIVSYDVESGEEELLTNTASNNMEPNRQGKYTVWQRWTDGGWNIVLFDGKTEKQITKTTSHNVAPYIHGSLVVWNQYDQVNEKTIEMYDIVTETFVTIEDPEGMSVANPRMVFVYDSLSPNGDIVTKGYDVFAKKFIDLDTLPRSLPEEIPNSDTTGETRALIQNKPSGKSEVEELTDLASTTTDVGEDISSSTPAIVVPDITDELPTLDLSEAAPLEAEVTPEIEPPTDLVIAANQEPEIPQDIVPFVEPNQCIRMP